ncbi:C45 family autoproteolytic acyltransferase/hydolase [Agrococcus sp. SGAir0287]|uniref:C45 family autoproteolytic acyltransferase/hydolase n=1 Tax=Agrococcus sp. SGAir0287 TaxID=2070347 RepID=UPI001585E217|nr:C45 family peptidase [Agrococcus sp. SGAir0287]
MKVAELRLPSTDAVSRGVAYGSALAAPIRETIARYRDAYEVMGVPDGVAETVAAGSIAAVRAWAPAIADELEGVARGADVPIDDVMLLTARTEILAHAPSANALECSTIVALPEGRRPMTMQTWDWHGELAPTGVLLEVPLADRVVRTFTETGMVGKIGVARTADGRGLGVHFNILHHVSDRSAVGVPVHVVARRILDEAATLDEAIAIARDAVVGASTVLTIVEAAVDGGPARAACVELSPARVATVEPADGYLAHTNHFLDAGLAEGEATSDTSTTGPRLEHALAQRDGALAATDAVSLAAAMCGDAGADAPVCVRAQPAADLADRWETLLTASLDVEAGAIDWLAGPPSALDAATVRRFG